MKKVQTIILDKATLQAKIHETKARLRVAKMDERRSPGSLRYVQEVTLLTRKLAWLDKELTKV